MHVIFLVSIVEENKQQLEITCNLFKCLYTVGSNGRKFKDGKTKITERGMNLFDFKSLHQ